jgi:hypothetical protein
MAGVLLGWSDPMANAPLGCERSDSLAAPYCSTAARGCCPSSSASTVTMIRGGEGVPRRNTTEDGAAEQNVARDRGRRFGFSGARFTQAAPAGELGR